MRYEEALQRAMKEGIRSKGIVNKGGIPDHSREWVVYLVEGGKGKERGSTPGGSGPADRESSMGLGACAAENLSKKMSCFQPVFAHQSALKSEITRKISFQATYRRVVSPRYFLRRRLLEDETMACRVGMAKAANVQERIEYWKRHEGHPYSQILHRNKTYDEATRLEQVEARQRKCRSSAGGPRDHARDWCVYHVWGGR